MLVPLGGKKHCCQLLQVRSEPELEHRVDLDRLRTFITGNTDENPPPPEW